ncbi:hypothetical protein BDQ12DRAFT_672446 [Crucibulum laeve]|uniref:DUF6699 domain-containing protein n=1 Tax=Crucibulum laeve TaxID=68775 RepID=A0A5C3MHJ4_9AGAR|nr:hypothetical protein BDQ12DRAFT_672446 [Crucibulum laeve]
MSWAPWAQPQQGYYAPPAPGAYVPPQYGRAPGGYWQPPGAWNPEAYGPRAPPVTETRSAKYPNLNPILAADTTLLRFDVRKKPRTEIIASTYYSNRHAPAFATPVTTMRLWSKSFPWAIDIVSPTPLTCEAIWEALHNGLQEPIVDSEWALIMGNKKMREVLEKGLKKRTEEDPQADKRPKRIDVLGDATLFKGLEKDEDFQKVRMIPGGQVVAETWVVKLSA